MHLLLKYISWLVLLYAAYCGLLFVLQRQILFPRSQIAQPLKSEQNIVGFERGSSLQIPRSNSYDELSAFTIEATIKAKSVAGRQNIIEGQTPPVAFFLDSNRRLAGSIHTSRGWQTVTSGRTKVPLRKFVQVTFTRDQTGHMRLKIDGEEVGKKRAGGALRSVGETGFLVGIGMDQQRYQFVGAISGLKIRNNVVDEAEIQERIDRAQALQESLVHALNIERVRVSPDRDESYARLQPVKSILSSIGVDKLTDLQ